MTLRYIIKWIIFNVFLDKQEHEALNKDKHVDYNVDENEAESETDKQAALAGIENGKIKKKKSFNLSSVPHAENFNLMFSMVSCSRHS